MARMLVAMEALSVFHNPQIINRRHGALKLDTVQTGDLFDAPWHIARDLARGGLATANDPAVLDHEPTDDVEPHPSLSVGDLHATNKRRRQARGEEGPGASTTDPTKQGAITGEMLQRPVDPVAPVAQTGAPAGGTAGVDGTAAGPKSNVPATPPKS